MDIDEFYKTIGSNISEEKILNKSIRDVIQFFLVFLLFVSYIPVTTILYLELNLFIDVLMAVSIVYIVILGVILVIGDLLDPLKKPPIHLSCLSLSKILMDMVSVIQFKNMNFIHRTFKSFQIRMLAMYLRNQFFKLDKELNNLFIFRVELNDKKVMKMMLEVSIPNKIINLIKNDQQSIIVTFLKCLIELYYVKSDLSIRNDASMIAQYNQKRDEFIEILKQMLKTEESCTENGKSLSDNLIQNNKLRIGLIISIGVILLGVNFYDSSLLNTQIINTIGIVSLIASLLGWNPRKTNT